MHYYTVEQINDIPCEVLEVPYSYTASSKNIYNSGMHIIRQIIASYNKVLINSKELKDLKKVQGELKQTNNNKKLKNEDKIKPVEVVKPIYSYILKENLHINSQEALDLVNKTINILNSKNTNHFNKKMKKYKEDLKLKIEKEKREAKEKLLQKSNISVNTKSSKPSKKPKKNKVLKEPKLKLYSLYEKQITPTQFHQYLESNLIINALKLKELTGKYKDYLEVSTHIGSVAVDKLITDYKNFNKAITAYSKNPSSFLGKPKPPSYKDSLSRIEYQLDKNKLTNGGILARVITRDNIKQFTSIKDKSNFNKLYTSSDKKELISNDFIEAYNNFSFTEIIDKAVKSVQERDDKSLSKYNNLPHNKINNIKITSLVEFVGFNFMPNDKFELNDKPKVIVQAVLKHIVNLPENNLLSQILKVNNKFLELSEIDKIKFINDNFKYAHNDYGVASIDPGLVNHVSMTFNNVNNIKINKNINTLLKNVGNINNINGDKNITAKPKSINLNNLLKGMVFSGSKYNNYVRNKELELDKIKSRLLPKPVKLIQSKIDKHKVELESQKLNILQELIDKYNCENIDSKDFTPLMLEEVLDNEISMQLFEKEFNEKVKELPKLEISKADRDLVRFSTIDIYKNPDYVLKLKKLNDYKTNYLHKLSSSIIDICNYHNINILIFGKNDGWKNKSNIGKLKNREQYSFAHTKLIDLLKYKSLLFGITMLVTEESYTSMTSFVNNSVLKKYKKYDKNKELNNVENSDNNSVKVKFDKDSKIIRKDTINKNIKQKSASKPILETINNTKNDIGIVKHSFGGVRQTRGIFINDNMNNIEIVDNENNGKNISLTGVNPRKSKNKGLVIHADINASFNIMRKAFPNLEYSRDKYSLNYRMVCVQLNKKYVKLIT